ncbi:hypothetical protein [Chondromyces crocatus]|uniref:Uncharacterized protein n=1 Tax=Chondromyces crocatus TaxID=52 RepID=A0A0K1ELB9_CHOCO|nr:hypothetical protein [Chondromyces crocatus]AKT41472.1 uncharacterized protein CMC5_056800 [Chondromyces crocatus]
MPIGPETPIVNARPNTVARYLRLDLTETEQSALGDALLARGMNEDDWLDWYDARLCLFDLERGAAPLADIARTVLGRSPVTLVSIDTFVRFDWSAFNGLAALEPVMGTLPGALPSAREWRYFAPDDTRPPYLWASHEASGLQVAGVLDEPLWDAWWSAFDLATSAFPRRTG